MSHHWKPMFVLLILFCTQALSASNAEARARTGNGGDVVVTPEGDRRFLDLIRHPDAIVFEPLNHPSYQRLKNRLAERGLMQLVAIDNLTNTGTLPISEMFDQDMRDIDFYLVPGPLPEVHDRGDIALHWRINGRIERLAVQLRRNVNRITVLIDINHFREMMSQEQRFPDDLPAFWLHELAIYRYYRHAVPMPGGGGLPTPLDSVEPIAAAVWQIFTQDPLVRLTPSSVVQAFCRAKVYFAHNLPTGLTLKIGSHTPRATYDDLWVYEYSSCRARRFRGNSRPPSAWSATGNARGYTYDLQELIGDRSYTASLSLITGSNTTFIEEIFVETNAPGGSLLISNRGQGDRFSFLAQRRPESRGGRRP